VTCGAVARAFRLRTEPKDVIFGITCGKKIHAIAWYLGYNVLLDYIYYLLFIMFGPKAAEWVLVGPSSRCPGGGAVAPRCDALRAPKPFQYTRCMFGWNDQVHGHTHTHTHTHPHTDRLTPAASGRFILFIDFSGIHREFFR